MPNRDRAQIAALAGSAGYLRGVSGEPIDTFRGIIEQNGRSETSEQPRSKFALGEQRLRLKDADL